MSLYRLTWWGVTLLLGGLFLWENHALLDARLPVVLRLPLVEIRPLPPQGPSVMLMLVAAFTAGAVLMYAVGLPKRVRTALELRKLRKQAAGTTRDGAPAATSASAVQRYDGDASSHP